MSIEEPSVGTAEGSRSGATDALVERLFGATIGTLEIASVNIGGRLGFYRALAEGDAKGGELAASTGPAERYAREWLEQQAVARFLSVDDPNAEARERGYRLPAPHRAVFVDVEDLNYLSPPMLLPDARLLTSVGGVRRPWVVSRFSKPLSSRGLAR